MKSILQLFAVASLFVLSSSTLSAQKVAHIDYGSILAALPDVKKADTEIETLRKQLGKQSEMKQQKMQQLYQEATQLGQANKLTKEQEQQYSEQLQKMQAELEEFSGKAEQQLKKKREELLKPILDRVEAAVSDIAKEKSIAYVFDASTILYAGGTDITADVKTKLGIQ